MSKLYSIGLMNQLADAFEKAGFTPDDVTKLRSSPSLPDIRDVLRGKLGIVVTRYAIDLDAAPRVFDGFEIEEHIKGGQLEWDPKKIALFLSEGQQNGNMIRGDRLWEELKDRHCYNANLLDFLLDRPELIPDEWEGVHFWGTIYRNRGYLCVRYLHREGKEWDWKRDYLGDPIDSRAPAAVPASNQ